MFISVTLKTESCDYYCDMFEVEYVSDIKQALKNSHLVESLPFVCDYWVSNSVDEELNSEIEVEISDLIDELQEVDE